MLVVIVSCHVKPDFTEAFKAASIDNASNSILEPGVARFDVYQQSDDPTRFSLVEIYRSDEDPAKHRQTAHYLRWRDSVADMLFEPRTRIENRMLYPESIE